MKFGVGQAVTRKEDDRSCAAPAAMSPIMRRPVRCTPSCCARRTRMRASGSPTRRRRARMPGVRLVLDRRRHRASSARCRAMAGCRGVDDRVPPYPVLARDEVRHVGDAVAFVVADTLEQARDAAEAIEIEWEPLPHVDRRRRGARAGRAAGLAGPARQCRVRDRRSATRPQPSAAFAQAARMVSLTIVNQRLVTNYLDTRGVVAEYDAAARSHHADARQPGQPRDPRHALRPRAQDPAATRCASSRRMSAAASAPSCFPIANMRWPRSRRSSSSGRCKWVADRSEHFLGDAQGRDNITTATARARRQGPIPRARRRHSSPTWARICPPTRRTFRSSAPACCPASTTSRPATCACARAYTNTVPVDAYRGAGRPEAAYVIERLVDAAAREIGVAPDALRRKNFIKPKAMPYTTATGKVYDSGEFAGHMARAQEVADWAGFKKRAARLEEGGQAARHRHCDLYRGLRQQRPGHRDAAARKGRQRHRADRHRNRPGRGTTPPMRRSSPSSSACRPSACAWSRATPT